MGLLKLLRESLQTLKGFFFLSTVCIAAVVFLGATFASTLLYEDLLSERTRETSGEIAALNEQMLTRAMHRGSSRKELQEVLRSAQDAFPSMVDRVSLLTFSGVEIDAKGATSFPEHTGDLAALLKDGKSQTDSDSMLISYRFAIRAESACLQCHANVATDSVMAILKVDHNVRPVTAQVRLYYIKLFAALGTIVLALASLVSLYSRRKIQRGVDLLRDRADSINTVRDLEQLALVRADFGFSEFNQIFANVATLVGRLRQVAVDKDVLEFEIRLLEKFIITSNVVKDWREFISGLLIEIDPIIDAYALVTIFRVGDEAHECEVFWRSAPDTETRQLFEDELRLQLLQHAVFAASPEMPVVHNVADPSLQLPRLSREQVQLQTKSLFLDAPRVGGVVGIGLHSPALQDNIRNLVIGSILTTLLNLVGSVKAISKYTKDLEHYATRDPLTNLYNQRMFWELLGYEVGRAKRHDQSFAVMVLDMDNFKTINDRYGHHFGDSFLKEFASLLHEAVRSGDLIARYGGDEFAIILPEADDTQAHLVGKRIAELLETHVIDAPDGHRLKATTSIGIAIAPKHGENPKDLFLIADNMMYKAKKSGKNAIAIPTEDEMAEVFRQASEKNLLIQKALDERCIRPYFQPISSTLDGAVAIHELLMRIQLEDRIVTAHDFIDVAESMGVVHKMDYQLIEQAFEQVTAQGYEGMLFINLSPKALIVGEYISRVRKLAEAAQIQPSRIVFEITERETVSNLALLEKFVQDLKLQGFSFAIDDFGSGYSSFQYIKHFPIDYIKIEGEFIKHMIADDVYRAFVKSIVTLAQELGIRTIAEYIEDAETLQAVRDFGIDFTQGYHIGRPSPKFAQSTKAEGGV